MAKKEKTKIEVITEICESLDFNVSFECQDDDKYLEISQYTPLGEDWHEKLFGIMTKTH